MITLGILVWLGVGLWFGIALGRMTRMDEADRPENLAHRGYREADGDE